MLCLYSKFLVLFPFSVRNPYGQIKLYCKGADTMLFERLHSSNEELASLTSDHLGVSAFYLDSDPEKYLKQMLNIKHKFYTYR